MIEISSIITAVLTASFLSTVFYASKSMDGTQFELSKWLSTVLVGAGIGFLNAYYGNPLDQAGFMLEIASYGGAILVIDKVITILFKALPNLKGWLQEPPVQQQAQPVSPPPGV